MIGLAPKGKRLAQARRVRQLMSNYVNVQEMLGRRDWRYATRPEWLDDAKQVRNYIDADTGLAMAELCMLRAGEGLPMLTGRISSELLLDELRRRGQEHRAAQAFKDEQP